MNRFVASLLMVCIPLLSLAKEPPIASKGGGTPPANAPATRPTTKPAGGKSQAQTPGKKTEIPSAAELMEKIKSKQSAQDKLPKVAHLDLSEPLVEKSPDFTLFGDSNFITMHGLLNRLRQAREDKSLRAVLVTLGETEFNSAQALEIRGALEELRKAGKRTFVYADSFETTSYLAASGATDICMLEGGQLMMLGVSIEPMFLRGLFDKVGIKADMIQIGEYKGADEQYTRTDLSPEARGELNKIADALYDVIVDTVSRSRNLPKQSVKQAIDDVFMSGKQARDRKLVDHLIGQDELRDFLSLEVGGGGEVNILANYAAPQHEKLDFSNPFALVQKLLAHKSPVAEKPQIALIHAEGVIMDGESEDGLLGGGGTVGGENIRKAFRSATRDDNVKAIVLRIDSPGGSALASEVMWQAVASAATEKPVIVSIGSMAASGGYYLASAGDYIFADPSAIVGSIGVVGGKFVVTGLFEKLGVTTESITRGRNADLFSMGQDWNDRQRRLVTNWMKSTYELFTERVMSSRKDKIKDIDKVARGRIFLASQAKELGMIDEIGGLTAAVKFAAVEAELKDYELKVLPGSRSLLDLLSGNSGEETDAAMPWRPRLKLQADSPLLAMPPSVRKLLGRHLQLMQIMDKRPVMLVAPVSIQVR